MPVPPLLPARHKEEKQLFQCPRDREEVGSEPLLLSHITRVLRSYSTFSHLSISLLPNPLPAPFPSWAQQVRCPTPWPDIPLILTSLPSLTAPIPFPPLLWAKEQFLGGLIS